MVDAPSSNATVKNNLATVPATPFVFVMTHTSRDETDKAAKSRALCLIVSSDIAQLYHNRQFATELDGAVKAEGRLDFAMFTYTAGRCVGQYAEGRRGELATA